MYSKNLFLLCEAIKYTVEADMERRRTPRVRFQDNDDDTYTGLLTLPSTKNKCHNIKLFVVVSAFIHVLTYVNDGFYLFYLLYTQYIVNRDYSI